MEAADLPFPRYPIRPAASKQMPAVSTLIMAIVIIDPMSEFWTNGCTLPFRGSKYQKLPQPMTIKAAPEIVESISTTPRLCGMHIYAAAVIGANVSTCHKKIAQTFVRADVGRRGPQLIPCVEI